MTSVEAAPLKGAQVSHGQSETRFSGRGVHDLMVFLAIVLEFGLLVFIAQSWDVEGLSVTRVLQCAFVGFIIHHFLPSRFRLPFFALLSICSTVLIIGNVKVGRVALALAGKISRAEVAYTLLPGLVLVAIGLLLIALCHLPIRLSFRAAILTGVAIGLALVRANTNWFPDVPAAVWVILGSMFVFRTMVYLYDMKNRAAPFGPARAVSYFFMLPNVCFPLFPLVDYKTFCTTYYNEDWKRIYQSGVDWMFRGIVQLLIYRAIYQYAPLDPANISSTLGVAGFVLSTYLLYLHLSGQFHLIVGLLHMFGFNLPETHHRYLLASSFTDFWRRINIYWKDFIMKLFFYPSFFAMRKMGTLKAMTLATLLTFFITWFLHSWQWFWIRGSFLFTWQDISFWTVLALLVLVNGLYEATRLKKKRLVASNVTLKERFVLGLKTVATFTTICVLWSIWSCQSVDELRVLADAATSPKVNEIIIVLGFLALIGVSGMLWGRSSRETSEGKVPQQNRAAFRFWPSFGLVAGGAVALLALPSVTSSLAPGSGPVFARLRNEMLNSRDLRDQRRGYYEELDAGRGDKRAGLRVDEPPGWNAGSKVMYGERPDFLMSHIIPLSSGVLSGAPARANTLGMRDREYSKTKPPNTHRVVLMGSSHELGVGLKEEETFENLVEDRLNQGGANSGKRWEILNMSEPGNSPLQKLLRLEEIGFHYGPDTAFFCLNSFDWNLQIRHLKNALVRQITPPPGYRELVERVSKAAGVSEKMPELMFERRLRPHVNEIYDWAFKRLAASCRERGVRPVIVYRPAAFDLEGAEKAAQAEMLPLARSAGLEVIDLTPAYDSVEDRNALVLAKWDDHTSALGHRLLAEKLYEEFRKLVLPDTGKLASQN